MADVPPAVAHFMAESQVPDEVVFKDDLPLTSALDYPYRRAAMGSTRTARRAGM